MPRTRTRWLISFGTPVLLAFIVAGFWYYWSQRDNARVVAGSEEIEHQQVQKTSAPQLPTPPLRLPAPPPAPASNPYLRPPPPAPPSQSSAPPPPVEQSSDHAVMPDFPWPPPKASAWAVVPNEFVLEGVPAPTFAEVENRLGRALDAAGYYQRSLFAAPQGFAIVTQLERIDDSGTPANASRWQTGEASDTFSLVAYLRRLLYADPGRYRLVVLIVSDVPFSATGGYLTASDAAELAGRGANALPQDVAGKRYSAGHHCTALIYEFRKVPNGQPEFVAPSPLPGRDHLVRANIWAALQGTQKNAR